MSLSLGASIGPGIMTTRALVVFRGQDDGSTLPLSAAPTHHDLRVSTPHRGPGRILHNLYTSVGRSLETTANRMAYQSGLGPIAVTNRIEKIFGESLAIRQEKLDDLFHIMNVIGDADAQEMNSDFKRLERECRRLMRKYASP